MPGRSGRDEMQDVDPATKSRSYGAPLGPQASVNATDRPKVGPAAPAVQKQALANAGLYRKPVGSQATPAPKPATPRAPTVSAPSPAATASAGGQPAQSHAMDALGPVGKAVGQIQANPANLNNAIDEQSQ